MDADIGGARLVDHLDLNVGPIVGDVAALGDQVRGQGQKRIEGLDRSGLEVVVPVPLGQVVEMFHHRGQLCRSRRGPGVVIKVQGIRLQ